MASGSVQGSVGARERKLHNETQSYQRNPEFLLVKIKLDGCYTATNKQNPRLVCNDDTLVLG